MLNFEGIPQKEGTRVPSGVLFSVFRVVATGFDLDDGFTTISFFDRSRAPFLESCH
jgi:hypothetical protein